ncbi:MAG: hypothetical protein AAGC99_13380 [Pseudomonadota bacterium]
MRDTRVSQTFIDPHAEWETERQALNSRYGSLTSVPEGMSADEYEAELDSICAAENTLFEDIKRTPTRTIAGALAVIEAIDHYQAEMGWNLDPWAREAMEVRARSIATIRRCLSEGEG